MSDYVPCVLCLQLTHTPCGPSQQVSALLCSESVIGVEKKSQLVKRFVIIRLCDSSQIVQLVHHKRRDSDPSQHRFKLFSLARGDGSCHCLLSRSICEPKLQNKTHKHMATNFLANKSRAEWLCTASQSLSCCAEVLWARIHCCLSRNSSSMWKPQIVLTHFCLYTD